MLHIIVDATIKSHNAHKEGLLHLRDEARSIRYLYKSFSAILVFRRLNLNLNADVPWLFQLDWRIFTVWPAFERGAGALWLCGLLYEKNMTNNFEKLPGKLFRWQKRKSDWKNCLCSSLKWRHILNSSRSFHFENSKFILRSSPPFQAWSVDDEN